MQKWILAVLLSGGVVWQAGAQNAAYADRVAAYIEQYRHMAIAEQKRSGIPAAITLAQGVHETVAGSSELATQANNHFGIKCKKSWTGETFTHTDDAPDECFRKYASAEASYRDHSDYLVQSPRYAGLFKMPVTDYAAWARGLKQAGYATNPRYAPALIKIIEDYKLQEFTYLALNDPSKGADIAARPAEIVPEHDAVAVIPAVVKEVAAVSQAPVVVRQAVVTNADVATPIPSKRSIKVDEGENTYPPYGQQTRVNGLKAVYARKGDAPLEYAIKNGIRYERFLELNDISDAPLPQDMYLYLERKHFTGNNATYTLKEGQTLLDVAQENGMQMKFLRAMNLLEPGEIPVAGTVLELQHRAQIKPELVAGTAAAKPADPMATTPVQNIDRPAPIPPARTVTETIAVVQPPQKQPEVTPPASEAVKEMVAIPVDETSVKQEQPAADVATANPNEEQAPALAAKEATTLSVTDVAAATQESVPVIETVIKQPETVAEPATTISEEAIAMTAAVKEAAPAPPVKREENTPPAQPVDELDALKAKFDRVIYSSSNNGGMRAAQETPKEMPAGITQATAKRETVAVGSDKTYTVKKGDTAFSIAKRNSITMRQLLEWNKLDFESIKVGQKLRVRP